MPVQRRWVCSACGQTAAAVGPGGGSAPPRCRNPWCSSADRPLGAIFAVGTYEGAFRRAIVSYKYRRDLRWAPVFGRLLHGFLERHATWFEEFGVICPVPSFIGQGARRPWGHTELVCAEVGRLAGAEWPVESLVTKVAETEPMSAKARPARRAIARTGLATAFTRAATRCGRRQAHPHRRRCMRVGLDPADGEQGAPRCRCRGGRRARAGQGSTGG